MNPLEQIFHDIIYHSWILKHFFMIHDYPLELYSIVMYLMWSSFKCVLSSGPNQSSIVIDSECNWPNAYTCGVNSYTRNIDNDILKSVSVPHTQSIVHGVRCDILLTETGDIYFQGSNSYNQSGIKGDLTYDRYTKVNVFHPVIRIVQVVLGSYHTIWLSSAGTVYGSGCNISGQLGLGDNRKRKIPAHIVCLVGVVQVVAGHDNSFAVTKAGKMYVWGGNAYGELGLNDLSNRYEPVEVDISVRIKTVICGHNFTFIMTEKCEIYSCGQNIHGQRGSKCISDALGSTSFRKMKFDFGNSIKRIACGASYTLFLTEGGEIFFCGTNSQDQDDSNQIPAPCVYPIPLPYKAIDIACGDRRIVAITKEGRIYTWGSNEYDAFFVGRRRYEPTPQEAYFYC